MLLGCLVGSLQFLSVQSPAVGFIQVVVNLHRLQLCDGSGVERILRDGDHHACPRWALTRHQQLQDALEREDREKGGLVRPNQRGVCCSYHDPVTGAGGEVHVIPVRRDPAVSPCDVIGNIPADTVHPLARTVGP